MSVDRRALENSVKTIVEILDTSQISQRRAACVLMGLLQTKMRLARMRSAYYEHIEVMFQELMKHEASPWVNNAAVRTTYSVREHIPSWDALLKHAYHLHSQTEPGLFVGLEEEIKRVT